MKTKFLILLCVVMCACDDNELIHELVIETDNVLSRSGDVSTSESYTVTPEMVSKYLSIARKGKIVNSLIPIIEDKDTLAYVVQYDEIHGWDLISGDCRLSPILAFAENGLLNINDTINPAVKAVLGMLQISRDVKASNKMEKHSMWKALEPKIYNNTIMLRGVGQGKWIATDTVYNYQSKGKNHIIKTKWGQKYPWNIYTPLDWIKTDDNDDETYGIHHTAVGCGAIAVGQLIYHYRKNNNRDILLPMDVAFTDSIVGSTPTFSNFSVAGWNGLAKNANESGTANSARFLSYLGKQLNLDYGVESVVQEDSIMPILNKYKLTGSESNVYDLDKVWMSLESAKPIITCANGGYIGHVFLIDGYSWLIDEAYVEYIFDPYYVISEEELSTENLELFEWPEKENPFETIVTKREYWNYEETKYISMNWGWVDSSDDIYFLAYNCTLEDLENEYGGIKYSPSWLGYNNVIYYVYNIAEIP